MKFSILLGIFAIIIAADTARANPIDPISFDGFDITPGLERLTPRSSARTF